MSPPNLPPPPENDTRPYDPKAREECHWHSNGVEDRFGRYPFREYPKKRAKIMDSILEAIGHTPLVKLNRIPPEYGVECNVYGKCEFLNAGGSVKDRIALRMVELAEQSGRLRPGMTVIEPTSGNTGIGLALACAVKGYRCVIVMPERMSEEKERTLKALGAQIVRTKDDAHFDSEQSHVGMAFRLRRETPNSVVLDQYKNIANPLAHYEGTADEILDALDGNVDMVVVGVGTGGSITGISRRIKKANPNCKIVGVDPIGSVLGGEDGDAGHEYKVEGIGYDFVPTVLDMDDIDAWEKVGDSDTFQMARKIHRMEGILSGGSAELKRGQNCVFLLPDGVRNYLTKFVSDDWMLSNAFMPPESQLKSRIYPKSDVILPAETFSPEMPGNFEFQKVRRPWQSVPFSLSVKPLVVDNIAGVIGGTPLVRLKRLHKEYGVGGTEILLKCEYFNPGGSMGDRAARRMVELAESQGILSVGSTIIEPSSGNTGIGLAMMAALRGYRCIVVMSEKMSPEKEAVLHSLGAEVVRTPSGKRHGDADSHFGVAYRLQKEIPGAVVLDQCRNEANPLAFYESVAEEILFSCDGKLDVLVAGAGTGGSLTGIAKRIRESVPGCKIVGVDPEGSVLADPANSKVGEYEVEGIGHGMFLPGALLDFPVSLDFVPAVLDRSLVDEWVKTSDSDAFRVARQLIRCEGFLCGGSSGANVWAALKVAAQLGPNKRIVTLLPDSIRNYMSVRNWIDGEEGECP
uniref:cystathionine beta-synthase n=1 Tax=Globodera pallida TaxID=36090 RepID=A0A183BJD3_GLOPA